MRNLLITGFLAVSLLQLLLPLGIKAQLSGPGSVFTDETSYPVFSEKDPVFVFCTEESIREAALLATTAAAGIKTWTWEKYNVQTASFELYLSESTSANQSRIEQLADGCYRVSISAGGTPEIYRAWVFNNWTTSLAEVTESNCMFFTLAGNIRTSQLTYFDLATGQPVTLSKNLQTEWRQGDEIISGNESPSIYNPPAEDTEYTLVLTDRFGCESVSRVTYHSIVTKASFTADPMKGEAPLEVNFANTSKNGDPGSFEWFFFRDLNDIKKESEKVTGKIDSIMVVAYDDQPLFVYENSGIYMVKLVSKKRTGTTVCTDTAYLEDYIVADTSFVAVPNIFTPNGDGTNDNFVVKFWSMKEVKISLFNRWGRTVHVWESGNVQGFQKTWVESAWDGKIGNRYASPGVYYYVVEGLGRDGKKRWKHGNVYLIRDKE